MPPAVIVKLNKALNEILQEPETRDRLNKTGVIVKSSTPEAWHQFMFPYLPGGLDDFVRGVIPELQRRGLFRREYEGKTLRENLGLPRPENRFFDRSKSVAAE